MKRFSVILVLSIAIAASAAPTTLFDKYEGVRQALLKGSVSDIQRSAKDLAVAAQSESQPAVAAQARALSGATTLKAARDSFATLSDQMIRFRDSQTGDRPAVVYCSMEKKSWLQPRGAIANPYVDGAMRSCGEIKR